MDHISMDIYIHGKPAKDAAAPVAQAPLLKGYSYTLCLKKTGPLLPFAITPTVLVQ